ncbi:MAG: AAA family ATPase [Steroidobacteraceae bacterium]
MSTGLWPPNTNDASQSKRAIDHYLATGARRVPLSSFALGGTALERALPERADDSDPDGIGPDSCASDASASAVRVNPYALLGRRSGLDFNTADAQALRLGISREDPRRIEAGLLECVRRAHEQGHCAIGETRLLVQARRLLGIDQALIQQYLTVLHGTRGLVRERVDGRDLIFQPAMRAREIAVAQHLRRLRAGAVPWSALAVRGTLAQAERQLGVRLSASQRAALHMLLAEPVSILTGGPGTGKTTLTRLLTWILRQHLTAMALAAPTGRAARQLRQASGQDACTLHRLLEARVQTGEFGRSARRPLETQLVVVDEMSMVDLALFHALLEAAPRHCALILIGDPDQLPSVGAGNVLRDLIDSHCIPTAHLTEVHRQAERSNISWNAQRLKEGLPPDIDPLREDDFEWIIENDIRAIPERIASLCARDLPRRHGLDPLRDIQVITPRRTGLIGAGGLNVRLQRELNPHPAVSVSVGGMRLGLADRVLHQRVNDDARDVYNGDTGIIETLDPRRRVLQVRLFGQLVSYSFDEVDQLTLAYAFTIHRAQGSEFPVVIIPVSREHSALLCRAILNTALSRARVRAILIGEERALEYALSAKSNEPRTTALGARIRQDSSAAIETRHRYRRRGVATGSAGPP